MSSYDSSIAYAICDPEWVAKTYSEYLLTCAKDKSLFMENLCDAVSDELLEALIDEKSDEYQSLTDEINNSIIYELKENWNIDAASINIAAAFNNPDDPNNAAVLDSVWRTLLVDNIPDPTFSPTDLCSQLKEFTHYFDQWFSNDGTIVNSRICYEYMNSQYEAVILQTDAIITKINTLSNNVCLNCNINSNSTITLQEGYVNVSDFVKKFITKSVFNDEGDDEFSLSAINSAGESIADIITNPSSIMNEFKNGLSSTISWAIGFEAASKTDVADRLSYYDAQIKNYFNDLSGSVNNSIQTVRANIANVKQGVSDFVAIADEMFGWSKLTTSPSTLDETIISQYTGSSPLGDIDFHTIRGVGTLIGGAVVAAAYGIWQVVKKGGYKIWSKVRPYIKAVTSNPEDIKVYDDNSKSYTVDTLMIQGIDPHTYNNITQFTAKDASTASKIVALWNNRKNQWYAYKTYFSEFLIRVVDAWIIEGTNSYKLKYEVQFKPRCVNPNTAYDCNLVQWSTDGTWEGVFGRQASVDDFNHFANSGAMYLDMDATHGEKDMFAGFMVGMACTISAFRSLLADMIDGLGSDMPIYSWSNYMSSLLGVSPGYVMYSDSVSYNYQDIGIGDYGKTLESFESYKRPTSVNNRDFLNLLAGVSQDSASIGVYGSWICRKQIDGQQQQIGGGSSNVFDVLSGDLLTIMSLQFLDRDENPGDYVYIPYSSDNYAWDNPRFAIKTDENNYAIADLVATVLVTVVSVILLIVVGKSIAKVIKLKKYAKAKSYLGQMDNAMWSKGKKMTLKETRKYRRKLRKVSRMEDFGAGLAAAGAGAATSTDSIKDKVQSLGSNLYSQLIPSNSLDAELSNSTGSFNQEDYLVANDSKYRYNTDQILGATYKSITGQSM